MKQVKRLFFAGALAGAMIPCAASRQAVAQQPKTTPQPAVPQPAAPQQLAPGQINEAQLGELIAALGLQAEKKEQRYDFAFTAELDGQEWQLSMSAVMSQDGHGIWLMAWLDELPKSSDQVPKTALLRLLAQNDQIGNGKFFSFIPSTRRFVMQQVIPNENMTSARLRLHLQDLGSSVVETYPIWSVSNWNGIPTAPTGAGSAQQPKPTQSATNDSKFEQPVRR